MPLGQPGKQRTDTEAFQPDEEALVLRFPEVDPRTHGAFYTPAPIVQCVLDLAAPYVPEGQPLAVIDPAAGAGAFLSAARERFSSASLHGLELHEDAAAFCRGRVPSAQVLCGDALRDGWDALTAALPNDAFELWVGNPPYNGTSSVLQDKVAYRKLCALFPGALPKGTSLRDDYAFFLLRVAQRLRDRDGALAFVTSATLLDAYLYSPIRRALLDALHLREVVELGQGAFQNTRVRTCISVWTKRRGGPARYRTRTAEGPFSPEQLGAPQPFTLRSPDWLLRPPPDDAARLDAQWRAEGEGLTTLVPVSSPGLKTRFDELLVDDDPRRLLERVRAFVEAGDLEAFASAHGISEKHLGKLRALKESLEPGLRVDTQNVRPFFRYAGARHRGSIPASARAYCYLDRRLIPRGDHRFRGTWDPHAGEVKLVFNVRELPLSAALLEEPGCVHDHRHARFAPLFVPERIWREGPGGARAGATLGPLVPNLSETGRAWAAEWGGPKAVFAALVRFINSDEVQKVWAPAFGAVRELHVTKDSLWRTLERTGG